MVDTQYNKQELILIGAGGLAREIVCWHRNSKVDLNTTIVGFIDNDLDALNHYDIGLKILGKDLDLVKENQSIIFAISDASIKHSLLKQVQKLNKQIADYIHESCLIGERSKFGMGLVMMPNALVSCDCELGDLVFINTGSQIGHDAVIGDYVSIMANVDIGGGAHIGNSVFIGSNAVILPGIKIADGTRIGAGTVVIKSIKNAGTYFGNPAKRVF